MNQGLAARYVGVSYFHINSSQMEKRGDESPYNIYLRRGVRSDAQLSCTETRFQKCWYSGKNGSKRPMLSDNTYDLQCDLMQKK